MYDFAREDKLNEDVVRARFRRMTDDQLLETGKAAASLITPEANHGRPPRETFVVQLRLAREEWRRRHKNASEQPTLFETKPEAF